MRAGDDHHFLAFDAGERRRCEAKTLDEISRVRRDLIGKRIHRAFAEIERERPAHLARSRHVDVVIAQFLDRLLIGRHHEIPGRDALRHRGDSALQFFAIGCERHHDAQALVPTDQRRFVAGTHGLVDEFFQRLQNLISLEHLQRIVVDEQRHATLAHLFGRSVRRARARGGRIRLFERAGDFQRFRIGTHFIKVRDRLRFPVFENFEIVFRQSVNGIAGAIGDHDVDVDDAHFDRFDELLLRRQWKGDEHGDQRCSEWSHGHSCDDAGG